MPADIHVDNGSQLKALENAKFTVSDVSTNLHHNQGVKIHVSNAKAHQERGRVEKKIGIIRKSLEQIGVSTTDPRTGLQWETIVSKISSTMDDLPLAKENTSNISNIGFDIITPNCSNYEETTTVL